MTRTDRIHDLHRHLKKGRKYSIKELCSLLDCSRATFMRIKTCLDRLGAPIRYDKSNKTYFYNTTDTGKFELPGVWFTAQELIGLATLCQMLTTLEPGVLKDSIKDILQYLKKTMRETIDTGTLTEYIRPLSMNRRTFDDTVFHTVAHALISKRRLRITYRESDTPERIVSPQTLVRYRDNWYLDAFCHTRNSLRTFALNGIANCKVIPKPARRISGRSLKKHFSEAYGLFSGPATNTAVLRFTGAAARYARNELWHPRQKRKLLPDGSCELSIPYGNPRELCGEILRWGPEIKVISPEPLRREVINHLKKAVIQYQ